MARNAIDTINGLKTETEATEYLTYANKNLRDAALSSTEALLYQAQAAAQLRGTQQGLAADMVVQGYEASKLLAGKIDISGSLNTSKKDEKEDTKKEEEEEKKFSEKISWIDRLLDRLAKATEKFQKSADNFFSWWRKNQALDKAISSNKKEINANEDSYAYYLKQANKVGLSKKYKELVQNGSIRVETIEDEELADKIEKYQEWYDKAVECRDAIDDLYASEREMINQKYDNIIDYYSDLGSSIQSVIDKVESLFNLNQTRGKRIDVNDLLEQFNGYSNVISTITDETTNSSGITAKNRNLSDEEITDINGNIDSLNNSVYESATYKKILADIAKIEARQAKLQAKGKDLNKKQLATLNAYYNKKQTLEENSTSDTIVQYAKTYDAFMKLQKKLDSGKALSTAQRKSYNDLKAQLENFANTKQETLQALQDKLDNNLSNTGSTADVTEANNQKKAELEKSYQNQIADYNKEVTNTKQYKDLQALVDNLQAKKAKSKTGTLSKKEQAKLDAYIAKIEALQKGGTAENISEYIKAYDRFQKLSSKKSLSAKESAEFDTLKSKLDAWQNAKADKLKSITDEYADTMEKLLQDQSSSSAKTESEIADNTAKIYETAKAVAELQKTTLEDALDKIDAYLSSAEKNLELYKKFGVATLKEMGLISEDTTETQSDLIQSKYKEYLAQMSAKQKNLKDQTDVYNKLIKSVESGDYSSIKDMYSGGVFEQYGDTFDKVIKLLEDNTFDGFSQTWVDEWYKSLQDVNGELISSYSSIQELYDTMREEVTFKAINDAIEQLDYLKTKLDSMGSLISDDILYKEDGTFSEQGLAKAALVIQQLENAKKTSLEYAEKYNKALNDTTFANDDEKQAYLKDLEEKYRQGLVDTKSYTEELMSLYENQSTSEIDALQDVIDKRKEALQAKKEYYDYDKNIKGQTKDIDALKAQIDAMKNISDAEIKSKKAQLEAQLSEKEDALVETKTEHSYELQLSALDDLLSTMNESKDTQVKSLEYQKDIVDKLKSLTENLDTDSIMSKLEQFYLGLGTDILGNEVTGGVPTTSNGTTTTPTTSTSTNVSLTSSIDSKLSELISATKNGITLTNGDTLLKSMDANFTDFYKNMINPIYNMDTNIGKIPSMISNVQPSVIVQIDHIAEFTGNVNDFDRNRLVKLIGDSTKTVKMDIVNEIKKVGITRNY